MADIDYSVKFTGTFKSYFKLWSENGLLLLISFGLLLPWTLLRKKRYFYQHTQLADSNFSFTAKPKSMFIGIFSAIILWNLLQYAFKLIPADNAFQSAIMGFVFFNILLVPIIAFFVNQAFLFRRFHSTFRGIRFGFKKNYQEAFVCCAGLFIFSPLTAFLAYPYFKWRFAKFIYNRTDFGGIRCRFVGDLKSLYAIYLKSYGLILCSILTFIPAALFVYAGSELSPEEVQTGQDSGRYYSFFMLLMPYENIIFFAGFIGMVLLFFISLPYLKVQITNWTWNALQMGSLQAHSFASTQRFIRLSLVNFLMVLFSCGLLAPLAKIRTQRFWTENKSFSGNLDNLLIQAQHYQDTHAMGDTLSDLSGLDMGI